VVGGELPSGFVATVQDVLGRLTGETRWLVQAGSVFGRPFAIHEVARLVERRPAELVPLVQQATAAGILSDDGGALGLAHDLVRLAVYGTLGDSVRGLLHREAAAVTRIEGRPPIEVAEHLLKTGKSGTREAIDVLHAAAKEVAGLAPGTAADLILRALD